MKNQENKRIFDLKEVGYTDLDGNKVMLVAVSKDFNQKAFANGLFANAQSIDMDDFARAIHKDGKAEITEQVEAELMAALPALWKYRVIQAIKETISKL